MHLTELESKMKQNSLEGKKHAATSSSSSSLSDHQLPISTFDSIPVHSYNDRGDNEIANIEREMRNNLMRHESLLDEYCDTIVDEKSAFRNHGASGITKIKKLELAQPPSVATTQHDINSNSTTVNGQAQTPGYPHHHTKSNGSFVGGKLLDPQKKNTLLATLKHIDNDSFDK